jgi:hypothetical protein
MKKIVRLTESDLVRMVQKVLNEQSTNTLKVKLHNEKGALVTNLDLMDGRIFGSKVRFNGIEAGRPAVGTMTVLFDCGNKKVTVSGKGISVPTNETYKFSEMTTKKILGQFCSAYSSTGKGTDTSNYA